MTTCTNLIGDCMCTEGCCNQQYRNEYHCCETGYDGLIECDPLSIAQKTCDSVSTDYNQADNCVLILANSGYCNAECNEPASTIETCTPCFCNIDGMKYFYPKCPSTSKSAIKSRYNLFHNTSFWAAK